MEKIARLRDLFLDSELSDAREPTAHKSIPGIIIWHQPKLAALFLEENPSNFAIDVHQVWFARKIGSHRMIPMISYEQLPSRKLRYPTKRESRTIIYSTMPLSWGYVNSLEGMEIPVILATSPLPLKSSQQKTLNWYVPGLTRYVAVVSTGCRCARLHRAGGFWWMNMCSFLLGNVWLFGCSIKLNSSLTFRMIFLFSPMFCWGCLFCC